MMHHSYIVITRRVGGVSVACGSHVPARGAELELLHACNHAIAAIAWNLVTHERSARRRPSVE